MILNLTNYSSEPIHSQIVNQILLRILEDNKLPGEEIDSISKISRQHHIGKTSVKRAFNKLEQFGVLKTTQNEKYLISNITTRELKKLIDRNHFSNNLYSEYELFNAELDAARQIQNELLPKNLPTNSFVDVSAFSTISEEVGGDFYDFFEIYENRYGIIIGDASGKGLPAAMLISQIQAIIKSDLSLNRTIEQTILLINSYLNTYSSARHFATMFYGILDLNNGLLNYINAGHNYPIIINKDRKIKRLQTNGPALGLTNNVSFNEKSVKINSRDLLFVFTDGLTERMDKNNTQFGEENIIQILKHGSIASSSKIINDVNEKVNAFSNKQEEIDDTTFMAVNILKIKRTAK